MAVEALELDGDDGITATISGTTRKSEVDIDAIGDDGTTIAIESKNRDYGDFPALPSDVEDLTNKLNVLSRNREKVVVVVSRTESPRSAPAIEAALDDADFPSDFDPEADLEFITYDELSEIE